MNYIKTVTKDALLNLGVRRRFRVALVDSNLREENESYAQKSQILSW